jgi:hypothetical protein
LQKVADRALHPGVLAKMTRQVMAHLDEHGMLNAQSFKALTGLSRRHAIPLMEWLDSAGHTVRKGDLRVRR